MYKVRADVFYHRPHRTQNLGVLLRTDNERPPSPRNARFLRSDLAHSFAEKLLVVQIDRSEARHEDAVIGNNICSVSAPSHADFKDDDIWLCRFEYHQCGGGKQLEARRRNVEFRIDVLHHSTCTIIQVRRHWLTIYYDGVQNGYEMGAVESTNRESARL